MISANSQTLGYDVLNRINSAVSGTGGYGSLSWTYDNNGNVKTYKVGTSTTTYSYASGSNRLSSYSGSGLPTTVGTNANGNITSIPPANSGSTATFSYGDDNRLASVSGSPTSASFVYDAFGQRYSKTDSGAGAILYSYNQGQRLIEEKNGGASADYVYADGRPIAVIEVGAGPIPSRDYILADRLGTPQLASNSSASTVWSTTYQPYGTTGTITGTITQNLRLPGQNYDSETGFYYNLQRDYMPNLGRYLETDPIGIVGGFNTYLYVAGNPLSYIDLDGLWPLGAPTSGFDFGPIHVPSEQTVINQLQQALSQSGTCRSPGQARDIAIDITNQVGWGDLNLAQALLNAIQTGTPLTPEQLRQAQNFISKLPEVDQQPLNQLLGTLNRGGR